VFELVKIFFASDIHGSERCWVKFLRAAEFYNVDVLIMGGDLTGKLIVPIIERNDGSYTCSIFGKDYVLRSRKEIEEMEEKIRFSGYYPYVTTEAEVEELQADDRKVDKLFDKLMVESVKRWMDMAEERVKDDVMVVVSPGNDDRFVIDDVIKSSKRVIYPEERVVYIDEHPMISCCWVNPTPWNSPRETSEEELEKRLRREFDRVGDYEKLICNFHAPPYKSGLDLAPKLDKKMRVKYFMGKPQFSPVGSKAVLKVIKEFEPMLGLHGHIHESTGEKHFGRTLCINPGSEYGEGILKGYIIEVKNGEVRKHWKVEG